MDKYFIIDKDKNIIESFRCKASAILGLNKLKRVRLDKLSIVTKEDL